MGELADILAEAGMGDDQRRAMFAKLAHAGGKGLLKSPAVKQQMKMSAAKSQMVRPNSQATPARQKKVAAIIAKHRAAELDFKAQGAHTVKIGTHTYPLSRETVKKQRGKNAHLVAAKVARKAANAALDKAAGGKVIGRTRHGFPVHAPSVYPTGSKAAVTKAGQEHAKAWSKSMAKNHAFDRYGDHLDAERIHRDHLKKLQGKKGYGQSAGSAAWFHAGAKHQHMTGWYPHRKSSYESASYMKRMGY